MVGVLLMLLLPTADPVAPAASAAAPPDVAVVCPAEFRSALAPWVEFRRQQGRRIFVLASDGTPADIQRRIRDAAPAGKLKFVLLVGDAEPAPAARDRSIPTELVDAKINVRWGSEPKIATDLGYADLDGDRQPDVALGRLPADSPEELARIVRKIIAYEQSPDPGPWQRQVHLVAGVGGFGALADTAIETGARLLITDHIPPAYAITMTQASWQSPYCPEPPRFRDAIVERLNGGGLLWCYFGHGQRRHLDYVHTPRGWYDIFTAADVGRLRCRQGRCIAVFFACYTGAFDEPQDCLAEDLLRAEDGPVAVLAGSRMTMPYAMSVLGMELIRECFVERRETLGEVILHAKRRSMQASAGGTRKVLDTVATFVSPAPVDLAGERQEHLYLMNLIGDPLLRVPLPKTAQVTAASRVTAGEKLTVTCQCDVAGRCTAELVVRRDRLTFTPPRRTDPAAPAASAEFASTYRQANDPRLAAATATCENGHCQLTLEIPATATGPCHLRILIQGRTTTAIGSCNVYVERAKPPTTDTPNPPRQN